MKGFVIGMTSAILAAAFGVYWAWYGFASSAYDGWDLGMFGGSLGTIFGVTSGIVGALAGRWMSHQRTPAASVA